MRRHLLSFLFAVLVVSAASAADPWADVEAVLNDAVAKQVFPGCVALVATKESHILFGKGFGSFTYGIPPPFSGGVNLPMTLSTKFDLASLTKVTSTLSGVALLYQWGMLDLNMPVSDETLLGAEFGEQGKAGITSLNCLLHNTGFPPDPSPNYWSKSFGCPQTLHPQPAMDFSCRDQIWSALMNQTLDRPIGKSYVYSDLSFLTLKFIVGRLALSNKLVQSSDFLPNCLSGSTTDVAMFQCAFEAFLRLYVFKPLLMTNTMFLPPQSMWGGCAPAENETAYPQYQNKAMQGQVSDGNAYALGGIAGHAGLFSTATDLSILMARWMWPTAQSSQSIPIHLRKTVLPERMAELFEGTEEGTYPFLNSTTVALFIREFDHSQSSRALGWNTNDPAVFDMGWNLSCGSMAASTFMHLGYTGTELCGDIENGLFAILLTNRVYPTDRAGSARIHIVRQQFNDAVLKAVKTERERKAIAVQPTAGPSDPVFPFPYPVFKQCDPRWGSDIMQTTTICAVGCLMSSVSEALNGHNVTIDGVVSNPGVLNQWLRNNHGYAGDNNLDETKVPNINPERVRWIGFYYGRDSLPPATIKQMLDNRLIVIANVDKGHHFVLMTGYDKNDDTYWWVSDSGFNRTYYTYEDIVGYRLFDIVDPPAA